MSKKIALFAVFVLFSFRGMIAEEFRSSVSQENGARVSMQPERKDSAHRNAITGEEISRSGRGDPKYERKPRKEQAKGGRVEASGSRRSEAKASVTWRVPHEKGGQPEAGFNLDYLPPKTHPPVHN